MARILRPRLSEAQKVQREERRRQRAQQRTRDYRRDLKIRGEPETAEIAALLLKAFLITPALERHQITRSFLAEIRDNTEYSCVATLRRMKRLRRNLLATAEAEALTKAAAAQNLAIDGEPLQLSGLD